MTSTKCVSRVEDEEAAAAAAWTRKARESFHASSRPWPPTPWLCAPLALRSSFDSSYSPAASFFSRESIRHVPLLLLLDVVLPSKTQRNDGCCRAPVEQGENNSNSQIISSAHFLPVLQRLDITKHHIFFARFLLYNSSQIKLWKQQIFVF